MKKWIVSLLSITIILIKTNAQSPFEYALQIDSIAISGIPGLHAYAFAVANDKWLIVGGRKDGLHARQPFASFLETDNNTDIYVIDIQTQQFWSASVNTLPTNIKEQLQSTNTNFYQDGDTLVIIGGYAYAASVASHITLPYLTTIQVSSVINAIISGSDITPYFKQINDDLFAVTGGELGKIGNTYYLVGGQRFDGQYNPMGHPTYVQSYTNAIQKFKLNNTGTELDYSDYIKITDPIHLHRRDYNLLPQIFTDGTEGYTISSGVFQELVDLPFLYPVDINVAGYTPKTDFNQYLSNYHTAHATLYDSIENKMHALFFGGISQYYYADGALFQDDNVPFVKTISGVTRFSDGSLVEYAFPLEMPGFRGTSAEFIINRDFTTNNAEIIQLNKVGLDTIIIGHIFGGINSPLLNPFSTNQTNTTYADNTIFVVKLVKSDATGIEKINVKNPYELSIYPNPTTSAFTLSFATNEIVAARYFITNVKGELIQSDTIPVYNIGNVKHVVKLDSKFIYQNLLITVVLDNTYYLTKTLVME